MQVIDTVELNGTYLYHATVIPGDTKANRKAKKIESIREKFEKISATSSSLPHKKVNQILLYHITILDGYYYQGKIFSLLIFKFFRFFLYL